MTTEIIVNNEELESELNTYSIILDKAIENKSSDLIPNSGAAHAAIMMSKMFNATQTSVKMVVGDFNGEVSNREVYQNSISKILSDNRVNIQVLILEEPNKSSEILKKFDKHIHSGNKKVEYKKASLDSKSYLSTSFKNNKILHFSVFDNDKFRLEISPENYSAFGCFNDIENASKLINVFDKAFLLS